MIWEKFYVEIQGGHVTPLTLPGGAHGLTSTANSKSDLQVPVIGIGEFCAV